MTVRKKIAKLSLVLLFMISLMMYHSKSVSAAYSNLVVNGGFENNPEYDDTWGLESSAEKPIVLWDGEVYHGESGHSINIRGNNESTYLYNVIGVQPNQTYNFSAWLKTENVTASEDQLGAFITIVQLDSNREVIDSTIYSSYNEGTLDWKQESFEFVTNYNAVSVYISLKLDGLGDVWYDDISFMASDNSIPAAWSSLEAIPGKDRSSFVGFDVTLNGSSSIGELRYQWRYVSKPEGSKSELNNSTSFNPNFTPDVPGDYVIGLIVGDGEDISQERTITIRAKEMNDSSDDMSYYQLEGNPFISGYSITSFVPLTDGWVILNDLNKNEVIIINGITGEVAKSYHLNAAPTRIEFDFDHNVILATQQNTRNIAKIDVMKDTITYITTSGVSSRLTMGEENLVFALNLATDIFSSPCISIIDLVNNVELKTIPIVNDDNIRSMKYNKVCHNLFLGEGGMSPSTLYKYEYNVQSKSLHNLEIKGDAGKNGMDLAVSNDGRHLAFPCGGGNGKGYTIFDYNTSSITYHNGEWNTDAYPTSADFSSDSKYIIATNSKNVMLFDVDSHELVNTIATKDNLFANNINSGYASLDLVRFSKGNNIVFAQSGSYHSSESGIFLLKSGIQCSNDPITLDSITIDKTSPIETGDEVNIAINALGGIDKQYGYLIYDGSTWSTLQSYSDNCNYTWKPMETGEYTIVAVVKDKNSNNNYDDLMVMNYDVFLPSFEPVSNIASGVVPYGTSITLSSSIPEADIYYTLDGSTPTQLSTLYTAPIVVTKDVTVKAIAITDSEISTVSTYHYSVQSKPITPPIVTPTVPPIVTPTVPPTVTPTMPPVITPSTPPVNSETGGDRFIFQLSYLQLGGFQCLGQTSFQLLVYQTLLPMGINHLT